MRITHLTALINMSTKLATPGSCKQQMMSLLAVHLHNSRVYIVRGGDDRNVVPFGPPHWVPLQNPFRVPFLYVLFHAQERVRTAQWKVHDSVSAGGWDLPRRKSVSFWVWCEVVESLHGEFVLHCETIPRPQEHLIWDWRVLLLYSVWAQARRLLYGRIL